MPGTDEMRIRELQEQNTMLSSLVASYSADIASLNAKMASMKETIEKLQRMLFGRKSEKVVGSDAQMLLPGLEFLAENNPPRETEHVCAHDRKKAAGQPRAGWNGFPDDLEREEKVIDLPSDERDGLEFVGYDVSERLVHRSAYVVQVVKRAKYTRHGDPGFGVVTAPAPPVPSCLSADTDRCHYDVSVIVHVIAEKLVDHIPFYRQSEMFARLGVGFGRSAMCNYFAKVSDALVPLYGVMAADIMECEVIHADETHVDMLDRGSGKTRTAWIWVRRTGVGPPLTAFHFSRDRSKGTAEKLFGDYCGTIIRDGYAAYGDLPAEAAGCWAHCRRKFIEAADSHPQYADQALALVRALYMNERIARDAAQAGGGETALFKQRRRLRTKSATVAEQYFALCRRIAAGEPPSSAIAKAAAYSLRQEAELRRFLGNPKLNIDNNPCENVIRPFCIGRRNWLFVGNENGGTSMAVLASFAATCKDNGVDFEKWLEDVLTRLDTCKASEMRSLLPHIWKQTH